MGDLPVMLKVRDRHCVIVGGGAVAVRRASALREAGAEIVLIAPQIDDELEATELTIRQRPYRRGDLEGATLVVVATDDPPLNESIAADARALGVLVNRTDDPEKSDIDIPAHCHHGPVTLAVHTGGISSAAAGAIRRQLSEALDPDWTRMLQIIAPFRHEIQSQVNDPALRHQKLTSLGSAEAMHKLKNGGEEALRRYCRRVGDLAADAPTCSE